MAVNINIVGDFCVSNLGNLAFGVDLKTCLSKADLNIVNMEGPIINKNAHPIQKTGPNLSQDEDAPYFLEKNKFNIASLANNHIMDYGAEGFQKTVESFSNTILLGCGTWKEAYMTKYSEINDVKVGFLALTQHEFGVLDDISYCNKNIGTAWLMHPDVDELILNAKKQCDFLLILAHAGLEHFCLPLPELRTLYRHFIKMGADGVISCHSHMPQCWEIYADKPIVYSLGNFCFNALNPQNKYWDYGLIAQLSLGGKQVSLNIEMIHFCRATNSIDITFDKDLSQHLQYINSIFRDEKEYIKMVEKQCESISFMYQHWFEQSGYVKPEIRKYLKLLYQRLIAKCRKKEQVFDKSYMINNLRCEPHRWVLSRLYEINKKKL